MYKYAHTFVVQVQSEVKKAPLIILNSTDRRFSCRSSSHGETLTGCKLKTKPDCIRFMTVQLQCFLVNEHIRYRSVFFVLRVFKVIIEHMA